SSVYRAVDKKSGLTVGLKLYKRAMLNDMERHQIAREIWLHIQLHHPSIIALYAAWKDRDYIYMVLEWAPEVRDWTRCLPRVVCGALLSSSADQRLMTPPVSTNGSGSGDCR